MAGVSNFQSHPGLGISGKVDGRTVSAGNEKFFQQKSISFDALAQTAGDLRHNGQTVVFVVIDGKPAGLIGIADPIKPSTAPPLRDLKGRRITDRLASPVIAATCRSRSRQAWHRRLRSRNHLPDKKSVLNCAGCNKRDAPSPMAGDGIPARPHWRRPTCRRIAMSTGDRCCDGKRGRDAW